MSELEALTKLIRSVQSISIISDIAIGVAVIVGMLFTFFWQRKQIGSLKEYIELWKPSGLKQEMEAFLALKDEMNKAVIEKYKDEIAMAKNKEQEATEILRTYQQYNNHLIEKLIRQQPVTQSDLAPPGTDVSSASVHDAIRWTIKFKDGQSRSFIFPLKRDSRTDG